MSPRSTVASVSRIAYLTSDVLVDLTHSSSQSNFVAEWSSQDSSHRPSLVTSIPIAHFDPSAELERSNPEHLITLTFQNPDRTFVSRLLPHVSSLVSRAIVLHLAVQNHDLSDALLLSTSFPYVLHSHSPQNAHDNALIASKLARKTRKAVVHIFYNSATAKISELESAKVKAFLERQDAHLSNGKVTNGHSNGHGHENGNGHLHESSSSSSGKTSPIETAQDTLFKAYTEVSLPAVAMLRRALRSLSRSTSSHPHILIFSLGSLAIEQDPKGHVSVVDVSLLKPLPLSQIIAIIPPTVREIIVLEQLYSWSMKWTPLFMDVATALQHLDENVRPKLRRGVIGKFPYGKTLSTLDLHSILEKQASSTTVVIGTIPSQPTTTAEPPHVPSHESSYTKILSFLFADRLEISNAPELVPSQGKLATNPEFSLGRIRAQTEERKELVLIVEELLQDELIPRELHTLLSRWHLSREDVAASATVSEEIDTYLKESDIQHPKVSQLKSLQSHLETVSRWIIGSDAWSYDLGSSGLHHAITSGLNVNLLILDTLPYTKRNASEPERRKKDIGLYAMNYGNVYVASVAVYSSYGQVLQALVDADRFQGTSIVLAYLPYQSETDSALSILKETKLAVDAGYWPLYRWDPSNESQGKEPLSLDSEAVKTDLQEFIDRQNHLSQLVLSEPKMASSLIGSMGKHLQDSRRQKAKEAYDKLLNTMDGPPLLILYASDGGAAEKIAKRLGQRAKVRGLSSRIQTMDSLPLAELANEDDYVIFVTSTAGQGEPPQNGRDTFKAINAAVSRGEKLLSKLQFSVFAMGDSHYWPRPEDAHYYNKPGKDLNQKLELLGGQRFAELGLGDDQDDDGPQTGYKIWEPLLWKALGVDAVEITEAEPEPITNENIKIASNYLRGTITEGLQDESTGALAPSDGQLTKFHGIYEQDDRDIRDERKDQGLEPAYAFMIRCRLPGGVCTPTQWLSMDQIADEHGNGTFKMTTRQTFQFHGVIKRHLKPAIQGINRALMDTIAACGDVNRNVLCCSLPELSHLHTEAYQFAKRLSERMLPKTTAYHEIWLDKKQIAGDAVKDFEPMYGAYYLPRKFKIAVAIPPNNDVDVFANDVGFIAIADSQGCLSGFNVTAGGGMGVTHSNKKTYPRTGDLLGFCTVEQGYEVAEKILLTQRDNGNRQDRKNARLKYTIDRMGFDNFKNEVEHRLGYKLEPARPFSFDRNIDDFGWSQSANGKHNFTIFIENGRVADEPGKPFKSALREIAKTHKGSFRLTANQHLILAEVAPEDLSEMKRLLAKHKLDNIDFSGLRLSSSACVAFPTCGLAMAESERYLPLLIDKVEKMCEENGLRHDSIVMRMTGCPNGCARPYVAEVAFVGKSPGAYLMLLGGGYYGQRLNKIYRENVTEPEILAILGPMIKHYALERLEGERFGDFVIRAGYITPTTSGKEWYDRMGGEGQYREISS